MKILRATHLGMCFGVRDAIQLALERAASDEVTVLGELAHNPTVNDELRKNGVRIETELSRVQTHTVMVTAHGASRKSIQQILERGHRVLEATCPLVRHVHRTVEALVAEGFHPIVIGKRDHVEVRGLIGDLKTYDVVLEPSDVSLLLEHPRYGIVAQTTQPVVRVEFLVNLIRRKFPGSEVRFVDTVCRPTKERQESALALARACDVVVVIGGRNSNNTRELAATCRRHCPRVFQIESATELRADWFGGVETVGLTAGTSTPDSVIEEVEHQMHSFSNKGIGR